MLYFQVGWPVAAGHPVNGSKDQLQRHLQNSRRREVPLIWPAALPMDALGRPKLARLKALNISQR